MYKVTKIGLLNFWLYDEEEFDFSDGKLLLRGENGSGKSVTMQSFIPLILDGNKSPSRLDPFGSSDKHIEAYVLGGIDMEQREEATSYLYMETYLEAQQKYVTIGMGLHGKRGRPIEFFGFALIDGRRVGKEFLLYKNRNEKIPLSKNELRSALGTENKFVETTKDYKKMVNNLLFGFPSLDSYDEFINVLLQLRSPKLSKEYKPTKLMEILNGVLQPLTEEDLRPLSDTVEEIDKTKEKNEQLTMDLKQLSYLLKTYNNYNETVLYKKAERYLNSVKEKEESKKRLETHNQTIETLRKLVEENQKSIEETKIELDSFKHQKENIDSKDLDSKIQHVRELKGQMELIQKNSEKLEQERLQKQEKRIEIEHSQKALEDKIYRIEKELASLLETIQEICEDSHLIEPYKELKNYQNQEKIDFVYIIQLVRNYQNKLQNLQAKLEEKKLEEERLGEKESYYDGVQKEYKEMLNELGKIEEHLSDTLQEMKDKILYLQRSNQIVRLTDEEINGILSPIQVYTKKTYEQAKESYIRLARKYYNYTLTEITKTQEKINKSKEKITDLEHILINLKNQKEEELIYDEEEKLTQSFLTEYDIPYIPFYKAIEFKENISEETKNKLESILLTSGLLRAYIIRKEDVKQIQNKKGAYLVPTEKKTKNLTTYFTVAKELPFEASIVIAVLESISIDLNDPLSFHENTYRIDCLMGYGSIQDTSKYIGILAREVEQQRKIKEQEKAMEAETAIFNQLKSIKEKKEAELILIEQEELAFPTNIKMEEIIETQKEYNLKINIKTEEIQKTESIMHTIQEKLNNLFREINQLKQDINLPLSLEVIKETLNQIVNLNTNITDFQMHYKELENQKELRQIKKEQLEDVMKTIEEQLDSLHHNKIEIEKKRQEYEALNVILNQQEYRELSKKLTEISEKLEQLPETLAHLNHLLGKHQSEYEIAQSQKEEITQLYDQKEKEYNLKEGFFVKEYNLHYVMEETGETYLLAKKVIEKLQNRKNADMIAVTNNYYEAYNNYRLSLNDYRITSITLFTEEQTEEVFQSFYEEAKRCDFKAFYANKQLSLYELEAALKAQVEVNEHIIGEQDRKLFEEVLLKTVGTKIRDRIELSKEWVKKINEIMKEMQQDSALSFQLEWHSKERDTIEELDTKELIRLFKIDIDMISPSDSEKLSNHFRSKLKRKVEQAAISHESYTDIIFEILDYRNWFEFKMFYQRNGENKKELTDKVFSVFSGGEKAKTMYLPLFTAICAKLNGAKENTLRLIALDEAFAGVDDTNIREMFGILSSLKLDYILTSQALYGDYDTIKDLSIAELLRPNNSSVVGVRRFHWNGFTKEVVFKKEESDAVGLF